MTRFISTRARTQGDGVKAAHVFASQGGNQPTETPIGLHLVPDLVEGKEVILAIHGFNVSHGDGVRAMILMEQELRLTDDQIFFGVLWPGDWFLPIINYPAEARDAVESGRRVAGLLNTAFRTAAGFSFISHSLGARVLMEAVQGLAVPARQLCITAAAADNDCLSGPYARVKRRAARTTVLASKRDLTLAAAYPLGDFASDIFWRDNDKPWRAALGRAGPSPKEAAPVVHRQIPKADGYDHGHYFPPGKGPAGPVDAPWRRAVGYMRRCIHGAPDTW